jgi:MtaA/CmuA family methyltransferase
LLCQMFLEDQRKVGYDCLPLLTESTFTAEAFGCRIGFKEREAFVEEPLRFSSEEALKNLPVPAIEDCGRIQVILEAVRMLSRSASDGKPVFASSTAPLTSTAKILGIDLFLKQLIREPGLAKHLLRKTTQFIIAFTRALIDAGADIIFVADPIASTSMISPSMFRRFALPELKALVDQVDSPAVLHICGDVDPIAGDMAKTGATLLSVDQCTHLRSLRARIGKEMFIGGNLNPTDLLMKTSEQVTQESWQCWEEGGPGNFILMPGCTIVPGTPVENIRAMMHVAKEAKGREKELTR